MATSIKNLLIGIFVLTALSIMVFMLLFLHPSVGDNGKTLRVLFTDIDKVNVGTRVTFAGKPVGEVISIKELPDARTNRISEHGDIYVYELVLKIDSGVDVFNTDTINLRTSGLLGERSIEINPQPLKPGEKLVKVENEILYAAQTTSVEDTMKQIAQLSDRFVLVLDDFHALMLEIKKGEIVAKTNQIVENGLQISEKAKGTWNVVDASVENIYRLTNHLEQSWTTIDRTLNNFHTLSLKAQHSWSNIDLTIDDLHTFAHNAVAFSEKANEIIDYTRQGNGTVGQLFMKDELSLRIKSILHKGEVVMNDINTYGLLFHLDKRWQRLQGRRLHLLENLSHPNAFAKYFDEEVDHISDSISRVSLILDESPSSVQSLISNPQFTQRFAELLHRVENMEETLKIFNEQAIEQNEPTRGKRRCIQ